MSTAPVEGERWATRRTPWSPVGGANSGSAVGSAGVWMTPARTSAGATRGTAWASGVVGVSAGSATGPTATGPRATGGSDTGGSWTEGSETDGTWTDGSE